MSTRALTAADVAAELGRSTGWLYENWRDLAADHDMPRPLHDGTPPLAWSAAQFYAWQDKELPANIKHLAAAIRAAEDAAKSGGVTIQGNNELTDAEWASYLEQTFDADTFRTEETKA